MSSDISSTWYIYTTRGREGPLSYEAIREIALNGAIGPHDLAWSPGMKQWQKASEVPVLCDLLIPSISIPPHARAEESAPPPAVESLSSLDELAAETFGTKTVKMATSVELQSNSHYTKPKAVANHDEDATEIVKRPSPAPSFAPAPAATPSPLELLPDPIVSTPPATHSSHRGKSIIALSAMAVAALGAATYFTFPLIMDWVSPFPKTPNLSASKRALLEMTAKSSLRKHGPKMELVLDSQSNGDTTFYIATNFQDGTSFDITLKPIPETLVGEPTDIAPIHIATQHHLAQVRVEKAPPGYYWVDASSPQNGALNINRKLFIGGIPDLGYQTHLRDYMSVRRGIAKAELDRLRDVVTKMDTLLNADNRAAETLSKLKIPQAKVQAWEIFQSTWTQGFQAIQDSLSRPSRFSGNLWRSIKEAQEPLQQLHQKHYGLVGAYVTPASKPLSPGAVTNARVFADSQVISNGLSTKLKALSNALDEREKKFNSPSEPIIEEP